MMRLPIAPLFACLALSGVRLLPAQDTTAAPSSSSSSSSSTRHELSINIGGARNDRLDQVVSPSRFAGDGFDLGIRHIGVLHGLTVMTTLNGGARWLASSTSKTSAERVFDGDLGLTAFPGRPLTLWGSSLSFGVALHANTAVLDHQYTDASAQNMSYMFGAATIGPAMLWTKRLGVGTGALQLGVPLVGLVAQPYSAVRLGQFNPAFHWATLTSLSGASAAASYTLPITSRLGMRYEYDLGLTRYDGVLPVRVLNQSLSVGFVLHPRAQR
jgi:hypothetical protein